MFTKENDTVRSNGPSNIAPIARHPADSAPNATDAGGGSVKRTWKQPFVQRTFSTRDVESVLNYTRPFRMSRLMRNSCIRELSERGNTSKLDINNGNNNKFDYWGREEFIRPRISLYDTSIRTAGDAGDAGDVEMTTHDSAANDIADILSQRRNRNNMILFLNDTRRSWENAQVDVDTSSVNVAVPKKKRLDALANSIYYENITSDPVYHSALKYMFHDRAEMVLRHYCNARGFLYGYDVFIVDVGGTQRCVPDYLRSHQVVPRDVFPCHMYDIVTSDRMCDHRFSDVIDDLQVLMLHVVYAVEKEMRQSSLSKAGDDNGDIHRSFSWNIPKEFIDTQLLERFQNIDHHIREVFPACPAYGTSRRDCAMWQLRDEDTGMEGIVVKPVDCLVWSKADKNDESTVQGMRRKTMQECFPESSLYVSCSWPLTADTTTMSSSTKPKDMMDDNDICRIKLKHDFKIVARRPVMADIDNLNVGRTTDASPTSTGEDAEATTEEVRCAATVLTVRVLGKNNTKRQRDVAAMHAQVYNITPVVTFVKMDEFIVPTPYYCWCNETHELFGWLNHPRTRVDTEVARNKATRMIWATVILELQNELRKTGQSSDLSLIMGDWKTATKKIAYNLDVITCTLNMEDGVSCKSVDNLSPAFAFVYWRIVDMCQKCSESSHRIWFKTIIVGACIAAGSRIANILNGPTCLR